MEAHILMIMMKNNIYNIKHYYNIVDIAMLKIYIEKRIQYIEKLALNILWMIIINHFQKDISFLE